MELRHLRYFVAVAEDRHFGRAARRLGIAQPPLSRQIQALEGELGLELFDRSRRRIELTAAGSVFLVRARELLATLELAVREAQRAADGKIGRLLVGYPSSVAFSGLAELLRAFRARAPAIDIALQELPPQAQIDGLREGRIDVGFVRGPLADPALASRVVRTEQLVAVLPVKHALAPKKRVALEQLAQEPFVSFPRARGPAFFDFLMRLCHDAGFTPRIVQEAPQMDLVSLVAAGFGVAIVPASVRDARRPGVVFRPVAGAPPVPLLVAWRRDESSPIVREFLATVESVGMRRRG